MESEGEPAEQVITSALNPAETQNETVLPAEPISFINLARGTNVDA